MSRAGVPRVLLSPLLLILCSAVLILAAPSPCDQDLVGNRWKDTSADVLPDGLETSVQFSFTLFTNGSLRADYSFSRPNNTCSGNSVVFADSYTFDNDTGVLTWNGSKCSSFGDKNCSYCPFATIRQLNIITWSQNCKTFNATRLIESPDVYSDESEYIIDNSKSDDGPHINKATVIALAVLGSMLVFIMIVVIAYCMIKGDTSRDKYDPIH